MLAALACPPLAGQSLELGVALAADGAVLVDAGFAWQRESELAATLRDGLDSHITFTLRLYQRRQGLAALLGDLLLAERAVSRVAFYDLLERRFVVEEAGVRKAFARFEDFLPAYLSVRGLHLVPRPPIKLPARPGGSYVAARAQFDPVRLTPPLTIVALAGAAATQSTPWVERDVGGAP